MANTFSELEELLPSGRRIVIAMIESQIGLRRAAYIKVHDRTPEEGPKWPDLDRLTAEIKELENQLEELK